jgi:polyhydroxybutyrate depolymerase
MKNHRIIASLMIPCALFLISFSGNRIPLSDTTGSIVVGGLKRTYLIHIPASDFSRSMPILIVLHGGGGNGKSMLKLTSGGFDQLSDKKGFIVVYPDGIEAHWNDGRNKMETGYETHEENTDDVGFISALIDNLIKKFNADSKRVFVSGMSNGAIMSYRLGCELSGKIAAIAPVAGNMPKNLIQHCTPANPVSVLAINSDTDPLVPFNGGDVTGPFGKKKLGKVLSAHESVLFWIKNNGCSPNPVVTDEPDNDRDDGTYVQKQQFINGRNNCEVILYTIKGGGHTWPGGYQYLGKWIIGKTCRDINATDIIWEFFEIHSLGLK